MSECRRAKTRLLGALVGIAIFAIWQAAGTRVLAQGAIRIGDVNTTVGVALTQEEAARPSSEWTLEQIRAKGWIPYSCFFDRGGVAAPVGARWHFNDPAPPALGSCIGYSFIVASVAMDSGEPIVGCASVNTWPGMPAGSAGAVIAALGTWSAAADVHFLDLVPDGGGPSGCEAVGVAGGPLLKIRIGAHSIDGALNTLAHTFYPPPLGGVGDAGDLHFDNAEPWAIGAPPPPLPAGYAGPFDVQTVALHELGHSLGVDHVGTVAADVMFPAYTGQKRALNPGPPGGDIPLIAGIYGAGPAGPPVNCTPKVGTPIPTVSYVGMGIITAGLLLGVTIKFARRRAAA